MTAPKSETYSYLLTRYGPFLTIKNLAEVLHSTPGGVRIMLVRRDRPFSAGLARSRQRIGRRIFFHARLVAEVIDGSGGSSSDPRDQMGRLGASGGGRGHE